MSALDVLSAAMHAACLRDLPDVEYAGVTKRPFPDGCDVVMFPQSWPNTTCGYDAGEGLAGQAFTTAYTVIVECKNTGCAAVYFGGGKLAYLVPAEKQSALWHAKLSSHSMPGQRGAKELGWYNLTTNSAK